MTDLTTADVLTELKRQLDWRGPTDKAQGNVVLSREQAEFIYARVMVLINQQDEHIASLEQYRENIDRMVKQVEAMEAKLS